MNILELHNINKYFGESENKVHVLKDVSLSIEQGDFVAIIGQSGSGKSTLMNILGCLDTATSGTYLVDNVNVASLDSDGLAGLRGKKFGFIFQRYNLMSSLSAQDNVALPAVYAAVPQEKRRIRAKKLLTDLGLEDKTKNKPNQLSGGQQQRVSIARALMNGGDIILADEPTGALDSQSGENVMEILMDLNKKGHTVIVVTHDKSIADFAHRIIEIKDGIIIKDSRSKENSAITKISEETESVSPFTYYRDQFKEAFHMSIQAILAHKMRSLLTMLGIIIGISAVVTVVALGRGAQEQILSEINAMGTNTIDIYRGESQSARGTWRIRTLTVQDAEVLAQQSYIDSTSPVVSKGGNIIRGNQTASASIQGVGHQFFDARGLTIAQGRFFTEKESLSGKPVVILDDATSKEFFGDENPIGQNILFDRQPLKVIGVAEPPLSSMGASGTLQLYTPYTVVMDRITGIRHISYIVAKVADGIDPAMAEASLTELLLRRHNNVKDFFTYNYDSVRKTIEATTGILTLLISGIAVISLIVGGIGVMNIMLVSVTERTQEIGVRMAIGAKQSSVLMQFLIEAVIICVIGGAIGVSFSLFIGFIVGILSVGIQLSFSTNSIILALVCSSLIGIIFGFMPAKNASQLNPVEALARD